MLGNLNKKKEKLIKKIEHDLINLGRYNYMSIKDLCKKVLPLVSYRKLKKFYKDIQSI